MSQPDSYLGLGAPIASSSTGQDHELDRNRLRELTQHQQLQDQPLMTQSVQPQPQTLHESGYTLTDVNHNIHGPTEMSNALLQGASEERIKVEQQIEVGKALAGDLQKGVTVHTFDPDASTAQKAREAAGIDPSSALAAGPSSARALVIDSAPASNLPAPTISVDDINRASREEGEGFGGEKVEPVVSSTQEVETLQKSTIGWLDSIGGVKSPNSITESSESIQRTPSRNWFTENIPLEFYGTAYHNAGLILFAVLSTRAITLLRLSWGWIVVLLAFCMTMYSISIERTRARARDDIQRELMKSRLVSESESADWINSLLDRAWLIAEPLLSATVVASVDEALKSAAFGPVESIRLTTFTLGNKAPRIDSIRTYPMTPDDEVIMEWALSFTPNDLEDLTPKQAKSKVNPKVVLSIKLGKGFVGGSIPVLLEDISFKGSMRIKLKLMSNFPHVQMVHMSFMEKPEFDYVLKPLGGEKFGMDVNNIPGLSGFIKDQVHANLGPMMYDPNVFTINLEQLLSGTPLDSAIGILKVTIESANGLKAVKLGGGAPDPYVVMGVGLKPAVNKTKVKHSTSHPVWNETQYILVNTLNESLNLSVFDYNEHRSDNALGTSVFDLASLITDAEQSGLSSKIVQDGKDRGSIKYNLSFYPVLTPKALPDGTLEPPPESSTGIVRLTIHQAKDLDLSRSSGTLSPYAAVYLGGNREIHRTATMKASNSPTWESATEFLVPDKTNSTITIKLFDDRALRDPSLGTAVIRLEDLLQAKDRQQDWFPLSGVRSGKVRITTDWKPLLLPGSVGGSAAYTAPIGVMRIWLKKAVDLKNLEFGLGGKSDPYVRVLLNHQILAKTEVVDNNLNPEWDEIVYIPVHHANDHVILEIMDHQNLTKDRHLGTVEVKVSDYILVDKANNETPYLSNGGKDRADAVLLGNGQADKGRLHYHVSFVPSVALKGGVHFEPVADPSKVLAGRPLNMPNGDSDNASLRSAIGDGGSVKEPEEEQSGVTLGINELLREQSGVLVLQVIAGMMPKKGRFEVLVDENATPSFQTEKARGHKNTWDQIGELVIRELDFSQLTLRMNENDPDDKPDVYAELRVLTRNLLEAAWDAPTTYILNVVGGATSEKTTVLLQARYVPLRMALEMRESVINMGILGVELIDAKGLQGSDRSGKSDPYVVFTLGGEKVFKSQVKKKTLAPTWNERFEAVVPSRFNSRFTFEIFDWNQIESAKSLGTGSIDLVSIEPFEASEVTLPVMTVKDGVRGTLRLRTVFTPQLIARVRRHTGTLSAAGRTLSTVGSTVGAAPIMVGKGVGHGLVAGGTGVVHGVGAVGTGVAHGVGAVGGFAGRKVGGLIKRKDKHGNEVLVEEPLMGEEGSYEVINERGHARMPSHKGSLAPSTTQAGRISITCLRAKGISGTASGDVKPYIVLQTDKQKYHTHHAKRSEEPEWNETFNFDASASALTVKMYDRKTIGKDKEVGEALIELNDLEGASAERWVELSNGRGQIYLRIDAGDAGAASLRRLKTPSMRSLVGGGGAGNTSSPGRFSFRKTGS